MYCRHCGKEIPDNSVKCPECGKIAKELNTTAAFGLICCLFFVISLLLMIVFENSFCSIFLLGSLVGEMVSLHKLEFDKGNTGRFLLFGIFLSPILTLIAALYLLIALGGESIEGRFFTEKKNQD